MTVEQLETELVDLAEKINHLSNEQEHLLNQFKTLAEKCNRLKCYDFVKGSLSMACVTLKRQDGKLFGMQSGIRALGSPMPSEELPVHTPSTLPGMGFTPAEQLSAQRSYLKVLQDALGRDSGSQMLPEQIAETRRKITQLESQIPPKESVPRANHRSMSYRPINKDEYPNV